MERWWVAARSYAKDLGRVVWVVVGVLVFVTADLLGFSWWGTPWQLVMGIAVVGPFVAYKRLLDKNQEAEDQKPLLAPGPAPPPTVHPQRDNATAEWISVQAHHATAKRLMCRLVEASIIPRSQGEPRQRHELSDVVLTRDDERECDCNAGDAVWFLAATIISNGPGDLVIDLPVPYYRYEIKPGQLVRLKYRITAANAEPMDYVLRYTADDDRNWSVEHLCTVDFTP